MSDVLRVVTGQELEIAWKTGRKTAGLIRENFANQGRIIEQNREIRGVLVGRTVGGVRHVFRELSNRN